MLSFNTYITSVIIYDKIEFQNYKNIITPICRKYLIVNAVNVNHFHLTRLFSVGTNIFLIVIVLYLFKISYIWSILYFSILQNLKQFFNFVCNNY